MNAKNIPDIIFDSWPWLVQEQKINTTLFLTACALASARGEGVKIHMDNFRFPSGTNLDAFLYVLLVFVGQIHMGIFHMDNFICIPKIYLGHIQSDFFIWTNSYATFLCLNLS